MRYYDRIFYKTVNLGEKLCDRTGEQNSKRDDNELIILSFGITVVYFFVNYV